jgi:hypothetical protein
MDDTAEGPRDFWNWAEFAENEWRMELEAFMTKSVGFFLCQSPLSLSTGLGISPYVSAGINKSPCSLLMSQISRIGRDLFDWAVRFLAHNIIVSFRKVRVCTRRRTHGHERSRSDRTSAVNDFSN